MWSRLITKKVKRKNTFLPVIDRRCQVSAPTFIIGWRSVAAFLQFLFCFLFSYWEPKMQLVEASMFLFHNMQSSLKLSKSKGSSNNSILISPLGINKDALINFCWGGGWGVLSDNQFCKSSDCDFPLQTTRIYKNRFKKNLVFSLSSQCQWSLIISTRSRGGTTACVWWSRCCKISLYIVYFKSHSLSFFHSLSEP